VQGELLRSSLFLVAKTTTVITPAAKSETHSAVFAPLERLFFFVCDLNNSFSKSYFSGSILKKSARVNFVCVSAATGSGADAVCAKQVKKDNAPTSAIDKTFFSILLLLDSENSIIGRHNYKSSSFNGQETSQNIYHLPLTVYHYFGG